MHTQLNSHLNEVMSLQSTYYNSKFLKRGQYVGYSQHIVVRRLNTFKNDIFTKGIRGLVTGFI